MTERLPAYDVVATYGHCNAPNYQKSIGSTADKSVADLWASTAPQQIVLYRDWGGIYVEKSPAFMSDNAAEYLVFMLAPMIYFSAVLLLLSFYGLQRSYYAKRSGRFQ